MTLAEKLEQLHKNLNLSQREEAIKACLTSPNLLFSKINKRSGECSWVLPGYSYMVTQRSKFLIISYF